MGMNNRQYMDAETAKAVYQTFNAVHRTGEPAEAFDWEVIRKDGTRRFVEASVSLMRDPTGEPVGFRGVVRDITDRKRAEEELRESEEKYRSLVSNINDLVMEIDSEANFTYVSPQLLDMFGYTQEESIGLAAFDFVHPDDIEKCMKAMETKDEVQQIEYRSRHKDGHYVHVSTSGRIISDGVGGFKIVSVVRDITDRKRAEEAMREYSERLEEMVEERTQELREAQEQLVRREKLAVLGQMAGGVGHELRNPLGVISNAVYLLQLAIPDADETTREYLDMISSEVRNSTKIISDLLDFSRTRMPERGEIAVSDLVAQVLAKQPPPADVQVTTELAPDLPAMFVDPRQIGQVLGNLVTNGCQAMPDGGRLTITAEFVEGGTVRNPKSQIRIGVSDTGVGIPAENMNKLFEPLFTTRAKGIGLGLALVKTLVEANGGSIEVESEEGKGSTFTVWLPPA